MSFFTEECVFIEIHPVPECPETYVREMFARFCWWRPGRRGLAQQSLQPDGGLGPCLALKQYVIWQAGAVGHGGRGGKNLSGLALWIFMGLSSSHVLEGKNCQQLAATSRAVTVSWWKGVQYKGVNAFFSIFWEWFSVTQMAANTVQTLVRVTERESGNECWRGRVGWWRFCVIRSRDSRCQ